MSKDMMEVIHQAIDELQIGLDKLDDKQVKETYNALVALQIELHRKYTSHYTKRLGLYGSKRLVCIARGCGDSTSSLSHHQERVQCRATKDAV